MTERLHTCTGERGTVACEACADTIAVPGEAARFGFGSETASALTSQPYATNYNTPNFGAPAVPRERVAPLLAVARRAALLEAKAAIDAYVAEQRAVIDTPMEVTSDRAMALAAETCAAIVERLIAKGTTP